MEQTYRYYAFISYQRKDEKWAEWLRNILEHYRLPSSLRQKDSSLPKEIRPIFRDALELSGGLLSEEIETALQQSKFLITLCSPNSAKSPWVNKEIQSFIDSGRERNIVPFIIDGVPFSGNSETECFPPALRSLSGEKEVLGININEMGRDAAAVKVVARMFGLKFDSLWQRYERERKRKRRLLIGGSFLLTLIILAISYVVIHGLKQREWKMLENNSRYVAETAIQMMARRDSILARRLSATILPADLNHPKDRPYVPNAEFALWTAWGPSEHAERGVCNSSIRNRSVDFLHSFDGHVDPWGGFVSFSPDSKKVYSCDSNIHILDAKTGEQIKELECNSWITSIAFSLDGKRFVSGSADNAIRLWDAETGEMIRIMEGHRGRINAVAFSPDGKRIISGSDDNTIHLWETETGGQIIILEGHTGIINAVSFSPDGKRILSGSNDNTIRIWDVGTGEQKSVLEGGRYMTYSFDNKQIVSIGNNEIRFWDANSLEPIKNLRLNVRDIRIQRVGSLIVASSDGKYFASTDDLDAIYIWDVKTGEPIKILPAIFPYSMAFSPDGKQLVFLSAADMEEAKQVHIWDLSLEDLLEKTRNTYPPLTPEERRQYFLEY